MLSESFPLPSFVLPTIVPSEWGVGVGTINTVSLLMMFANCEVFKLVNSMGFSDPVGSVAMLEGAT